jgi:hypothetical protein
MVYHLEIPGIFYKHDLNRVNIGPAGYNEFKLIEVI